jgi:hypothetical protein
VVVVGVAPRDEAFTLCSEVILRAAGLQGKECTSMC